MVLGFEPVHKPIIPRRSFFDKVQILVLTGMFSVMILFDTVHRHVSNHKAVWPQNIHQYIKTKPLLTMGVASLRPRLSVYSTSADAISHLSFTYSMLMVNFSAGRSSVVLSNSISATLS